MPPAWGERRDLDHSNDGPGLMPRCLLARKPPQAQPISSEYGHAGAVRFGFAAKIRISDECLPSVLAGPIAELLGRHAGGFYFLGQHHVRVGSPEVSFKRPNRSDIHGNHHDGDGVVGRSVLLLLLLLRLMLLLQLACRCPSANASDSWHPGSWM